MFKIVDWIDFLDAVFVQKIKSKKYADIIIPNYGGGYSASF